MTKIEVFPSNPVVQRIGQKQQIRVLATYASGEVRDVTREAFIESGNTEVATADRTGLVDRRASRRSADARPLRRGLRRDHADRDGRPHRLRLGQPPAYDKIDELVAGKWKRIKIQPSGSAPTPSSSAASTST